MRLIVGLGNPGDKYKNTRHNIGFMCIDAFLSSENIHSKLDSKFKAIVGECNINGQKTIIAKPQTYMNLSGDSVRLICDYYNIDADDVLVIHDDLYLDTSKLRFKRKGSSGGQNGIKDIISKLGTEKFNRLKFGIGLDQKVPVTNYVLGQFKKHEVNDVENSINDVSIICRLFAEGMTITDLMNKYN